MVFFTSSLTAFIVLSSASALVSARSLPSRNTLVPRGASPGFACEFPPGWQNCNDEHNRSCWVIDPNGKKYDINTNYEKETPPGRERPYNIEIDESPYYADGTVKPLAKLIDGKYPGTLIEACWGDTLIVNVKNKLPDNGTTIHWHGIRQLGANEMDGVNGVTQCPVAENDTFTYRFKLTQYGHSWYHSHYSTQYGDGVAGPLLIHGPTSDDWDYEWTPILVSDWLHTTAFAAFHNELVGPPLPQADTILVNGTGHFNGSGSYFNQTFVPGKRYLIRIINASVGLTFHFSIDNHILKVISNDFVPITPFTTNSLPIGIGQRYSVIVEAKPNTPSSNGKYWIRTEYTSACNNEIIDVPSNNLDRQRTGFICYGNSTNSTELPTSTRTNVAAQCADVPTSSLKPIVPWTIGTAQNNVTNNTYSAGLNINQKWHGQVSRWDITDTPMWLDFSNPTILNTHNTSWNPEYAVVDYNYTDGQKGDQFVYMVITSGGNGKLPAWHPIHLHGHDFAILAQSTSKWDPVSGPNSFQTVNATRRDVAGLPNGGYLAIAFKPDNPGIWLLHCHIAWHASSGLALQIVERQDEILNKIGSLDQQRAGCAKWDEWRATHTIDQDDSGI